MNGRTILKRMIRNQQSVFWGARSYMTFVVPGAIFGQTPPPPPAIPDNLRRGFFEGEWYMHEEGTKDEESARVLVRISNITGPLPALDGSDRRHYDGYVIPDTLSKRDNGEYSGAYGSWWEATRVTMKTDTTAATFEGYKEPWIHDYVGLKRWEAWAYLDGVHPVLQALAKASWPARATYIHAHYPKPGNVSFRFGVKTFYPRTARRFAAAAHGVFRAASRAGISIEARFE